MGLGAFEVSRSIQRRGFGGPRGVLPALVPGMTYEGMEVAEGGQAGVAYEWVVSGTLSAGERNRTIKALQPYCGQDTRAVAEVLLDRDIDQAALFQALGRFRIQHENAMIKTDNHYRSRLLRLEEINREFD